MWTKVKKNSKFLRNISKENSRWREINGQTNPRRLIGLSANQNTCPNSRTRARATPTAVSVSKELYAGVLFYNKESILICPLGPHTF